MNDTEKNSRMINAVFSCTQINQLEIAIRYCLLLCKNDEEESKKIFIRKLENLVSVKLMMLMKIEIINNCVDSMNDCLGVLDGLVSCSFNRSC